ncbi:pyruvate, phosphate dikinase [Nocardia yamanashiensis]|uniref:pyruvate, phosphate dikinase n=1 Tax=Nocardia yamanashiensis TaxID=209247 RepID=UPI000A01E1F8|nr:pyruvate, phosphate dikinase [Nocardia yamanashiensis]
MSTGDDRQWVLPLDGTCTQGPESIGGKAASLNSMQALGLPVPPAFVLTTEVWRRRTPAEDLPAEVWAHVVEMIGRLERLTGRRFGGRTDALLVSVRSGAAVSMPGMMDTVLNVGLTDETFDDSPFAVDLRHRFSEQFHRVVGRPAPADAWAQLRSAIVAVLGSWDSPRAQAYRARLGLPESGGTAVTVQAMVFGNRDRQSGTGVVFSRDPHAGHAHLYGEWLPGGQGEDVVSGRSDVQALAGLSDMPEVYRQLTRAAALLERTYRDVQDIEFTVESGKLWLLQTRTAKRSSEAAIRHAVAMARERMITPGQALDRVSPDHIATFLRPRIDSAAARSAKVLATGLPAGPGIGVGSVVAEPELVELTGDPVVLARPTTEPEDVPAMSMAAAVVTEHGGATSHAAVVCREMAIPCVVGCGPDTLRTLVGRTVTVDGYTGTVYDGAVSAELPGTPDDPDLITLTEWAVAEQGSTAAGDLHALLRARSKSLR